MYDIFKQQLFRLAEKHQCSQRSGEREAAMDFYTLHHLCIFGEYLCSELPPPQKKTATNIHFNIGSVLGEKY